MSEQRFPPTARLLTPADFKAVMDNAVFKSNLNQLLLLAIPSTTQRSRIGFVIARKKVKRALDRNRIKRVCRDHFRHHQADFPALDIVYLARQNLQTLDNAALRTLLDDGFRQLKRKAEKQLKVAT